MTSTGVLEMHLLSVTISCMAISTTGKQHNCTLVSVLKYEDWRSPNRRLPALCVLLLWEGPTLHTSARALKWAPRAQRSCMLIWILVGVWPTCSWVSASIGFSFAACREVQRSTFAGGHWIGGRSTWHCLYDNPGWAVMRRARFPGEFGLGPCARVMDRRQYMLRTRFSARHAPDTSIKCACQLPYNHVRPPSARQQPSVQRRQQVRQELIRGERVPLCRLWLLCEQRLDQLWGMSSGMHRGSPRSAEETEATAPRLEAKKKGDRRVGGVLGDGKCDARAYKWCAFAQVTVVAIKVVLGWKICAPWHKSSKGDVCAPFSEGDKYKLVMVAQRCHKRS